MAQPKSPFDKNPFSDPRVNPYAASQANAAFNAPAPKQTNGFAIAALVLTLIGGVTFLIPVVGAFLAFTGTILACVGWRAANKKLAGSGKGLAISAFVIGSLATLAGGTWSTAFVGYTAYTVDSVQELASLNDKVRSFEVEHGRLPLNLGELQEKGAAYEVSSGQLRDFLDNPYIYTMMEDGTFQIRAQALGASNAFLREFQLYFDSESNSIHTNSGERVADEKAVEDFSRLNSNKRFHSSSKSAAKMSKGEKKSCEACPGCENAGGEAKECPVDMADAPAQEPAGPDA